MSLPHRHLYTGDFPMVYAMEPDPATVLNGGVPSGLLFHSPDADPGMALIAASQLTMRLAAVCGIRMDILDFGMYREGLYLPSPRRNGRE